MSLADEESGSVTPWQKVEDERSLRLPFRQLRVYTLTATWLFIPVTMFAGFDELCRYLVLFGIVLGYTCLGLGDGVGGNALSDTRVFELPSVKQQRMFAFTALWLFVPISVWLCPPPGWTTPPFLPICCCLGVATGFTSLLHWLRYDNGSVWQKVDMVVAGTMFASMTVECSLRYTGHLQKVAIAFAFLCAVLIYLDLIRPELDKHNGLLFHIVLRNVLFWYLLMLSGHPDGSDDPLRWGIFVAATQVSYAAQIAWLLKFSPGGFADLSFVCLTIGAVQGGYRYMSVLDWF